MADNDPAALQPEVDPGVIRSNESQEITSGTETMETGDNPREEHLVNASGAEEPKAGANASEQVSGPSGEAEKDAVATLPDQATSPRPPGDDVPNIAGEHPPPPESTSGTVSSATPAIAAPIPAKRFTSMNINKKFLAKTAAAASPGSSSSSAAPKAQASTSATRLVMPNPATHSRLVTKKLTTATPVPSVSGGWSLRATPPASLSSSPAPGDAPAAQLHPSAKPLGPADALKRPTLVSSTSALSTDSRPSAVTSRDQSPVKAWASVPVPTGDLGRNLQDFPTAAEAAADHSEGQGAKRPGTSTTQELHNADALSHTDEGDARDSFRGVHLDPKAHHWDEMEDESNDFLGEVIDFGDGKTYTVPPEEEENAATTVSKETRFGDDYDRSWPRTRPPVSDTDGAHGGQLASQHSRFPPTHGLPPRQPAGDGRVLFNERSNRLEPARVPPSTHALVPSGSSHFHGPPHAHVPRGGTGRRNSALSASERPKMGTLRDLPPHARDPPPHAVPGAAWENRARRPSDTHSTHSPVERRSSFLHDEEHPRIGSMAPRGRMGDESGSAFHGLRRETSRDSRVSVGERQPWGLALQRTTSQRTTTDSSHALEPATAPWPHSDQIASSVSSDNATRRSLLSPSHQAGTLPTIPSPQAPLTTMPAGPTGPAESSPLPIPPAAPNDERGEFMKQAAERARRRKAEEEAMREEARERARKKAAELEALSKASLVSASPLVALSRKASATCLSSGAKSPVPKSPSVSPAALPTGSVVSEALPNKPKEIPDSSSAAIVLPSWRAKPEPEPPATSVSPEAPQPAIAAQHDSVQRPPPTVKLGPGEGMGLIEELGQADGPVEVLDFSDMSKLAGRRTSITSTSDLTKTKCSISDDFLDEVPSSRRPNQVQPPFMHWNRDPRHERPFGDHSEDRARAPSTSFGKHPSGPNRSAQDGTGVKLPVSAAPNQLPLPSRSGFKEAPISALDDVMSRIKGVLTGMHADNEKPAANTPQHPAPSFSSPAPASTTSATAHAPTRPNIGVAPRWKGDGVASWRDSSNKRPLNAPLPEAQPTEPFATTRPERNDTPPPAWKTYAVHLNKSSVVRPAMPKKQAALAKLPPMPVRWDILTWDPPVERMSTRTLSRDDTFFPKITIRGVLSARVLLPSTGPSAEAQPTRQGESPVQRTRLTLVAGPDPKPARSPNLSVRAPPKGPAFSETQWRKPQVTSPLRNTLELHNHISPAPAAAAVTAEENQLETTSRSPPPHHTTLSQVTDPNVASSTASGSSRTALKQSWGTDVAFHRSLHEKRPSVMPSVSFTVSSELDDPSVPGPKEDAVAPVSNATATLEGGAPSTVGGVTAEAGLSDKINGDVGDKGEQVAAGDTSADKIPQSPTPNSSVLLTPPVKATPPWQSSNPRLPDADFIKSVWQHASPKDGAATENSLRGLADDFPSSIPHSVQEMKADEEAKPSRESTVTLSTRMPHNAHRAFQHVPTSPVPMQMSNYPSVNHLPPGPTGLSRPMPIASFSLPPPAPPQVTAQPSPYAPYVHPTPPALMYTMPPSRIAPSPAPGGPPMWMQNLGYGRPSPPAGMYPPQPGPNMPYAPPVSQLPPSMSKPQVAINGNHHPMSNPGMPHPMHMTSPAMTHVGHMGSPALAHATPLMPGGPQHMYPGMNSPGGMGMGGNVPYGAQRPAPTMMQQPPMPAPLPNGYGMSPGGSFGPNSYGRANVRSPADGVPHHMTVPHPQHAPMSPGTYHPAPNGYVRA
ncbi:hypothetical protein FRC06_005011 [Ceratobasidium sp. 370]|nr:hypothetical protein FRC06_005011 [Ceratobasidium sp. 370]